MKKRVCLIIMMAVALANFVNAQSSFYTKLHARIAEAIHLELPDTLPFCMNNDSTWYFKDKAIRVRTNAFGEVSHIGYKIFDNAIVESYTSSAILHFVERYALELDLRLDGRSPLDRIDLDKVVCRRGNIAMLGNIKADTPFTIQVKERRGYILEWDVNGKKLSLTIPADYQLLIGANAIELEDIFEKEVKRTIPISADDINDELKNADVSKSGNLLVAQSDKYLSEMIRSDIYLTEINGKRELLIDAKNPLQSIRNIILTGFFYKDIPMSMTLNRYGYKSSKSDVTLQQFVTLCINEGCKLYFGVKERTEHSIKGTLFALNKENAYNHMLSVDFPTSILNGGAESVKGTAYVYIPLQNITEKFFTEGIKK